MKPLRKISRIVNLTNTQQARITVWLECFHVISITNMQLVINRLRPSEQIKQLEERGEMVCPHCPDVPEPKEPYRDDIAT